MKQFHILLLVGSLLVVDGIKAQDSSKQKTIEIISSFKPSLKPSAKINFNPVSTPQDSVRPQLNYDVPVLNLSFNINPAAIKPAALMHDSLPVYANEGFIKLGYGNFKTPFVAGAVTYGNSKKASVIVHGNYIQSKGKLAFQQYASGNISAEGIIKNVLNSQLKIGAGLDYFKTYKYGYHPDTLKFIDDQLLQRFTTFNINATLANNVRTGYGIAYSPTIDLTLFGDNNSGKETYFHFRVPIEKSFSKSFQFGVNLEGNIINYSGNKYASNNTLYTITPYFLWYNKKFCLKAGIKPSWDNAQFKLLPDIELEAHLENKPFTAIAGWKSYFDINNYHNMITFNPWIEQPKTIYNTRNSEVFGGIKGNIDEHFSYMATIGAVHRSNVALYINDSLDGKSYQVINETQLNSVKVQGEISYQKSDIFYWSATLKAQTFGDQHIYPEPYGLIPFEINSHLKTRLFKDFYLTGDLFYFEGNWYKSLQSTGKTKVAVDLNAGAEFRATKKVLLWLQFNNILNNKYQRWNYYPVLGFQALGGVKIEFK